MCPAPALLLLGEAAAGRAAASAGLSGAASEGRCDGARLAPWALWRWLSVGWPPRGGPGGREDAGCANSCVWAAPGSSAQLGQKRALQGKAARPTAWPAVPRRGAPPQCGEHVVACEAFWLVWCPQPLSVPLPEGHARLQCVLPTPTCSGKPGGPVYRHACVMCVSVYMCACSYVLVYMNTCVCGVLDLCLSCFSSGWG